MYNLSGDLSPANSTSHLYLYSCFCIKLPMLRILRTDVVKSHVGLDYQLSINIVPVRKENNNFVKCYEFYNQPIVCDKRKEWRALEYLFSWMCYCFTKASVSVKTSQFSMFSFCVFHLKTFIFYVKHLYAWVWTWKLPWWCVQVRLSLVGWQHQQ